MRAARRTRPRASGEVANPSPGSFDAAARWLLTAAALATPWWFGAVTPLARLAVAGTLSIAVVLWAAGRLPVGRQVSLLVPIALVPLLIGLLLAFAQLIPLPAGMLTEIAPVTAEFWSTGRGTADAPISLYPTATRRQSAMLLMAALVFWMSTHLFASRRSQRRLWWLLAINGAAIAIFGIVQQLTWNGGLYWTVRPTYINRAFGPYVNHNHAAGMLCMGLAGAICIIVCGVSRPGRGIPRTPLTTRAPIRLAVVLCGTMIAGVLYSESRSAFLGVCAASVVVALLAASRGSRRRLVAGLTIALVLATSVLWKLDALEKVESRLTSITNQRLDDNPRILHWKDALQASRDFLWTGSGAGTYRFVYPYYERREVEETYYHAENQYIESLLEMGVAGPILLVSAIGLVLFAIIRGLNTATETFDRGIMAAGLFALCSQAVQALFDFALYMPANMLVLTVVCGAVVGRSAQLGLDHHRHRFIVLPQIRSKPVVAGLMICVVVQALLPVAEAGSTLSSRRARHTLKKSLAAADTYAADRIEQDLVRAQSRPMHIGDAELQRDMAQSWIEVYRRRAYRNFCEDAGLAQTPINAAVWKRTAPATLTAAVCDHLRHHRIQAAERLREDPLVQSTLVPAIRKLDTAARACPLLRSVHFRRVHLAGLIKSSERRNEYVRNCEKLAARDPSLWVACGHVHQLVGQTDEARRCWKNALAWPSSNSERILDLALQGSDSADVVRTLIPADDARLMIRLASSRFRDDESTRRRLLRDAVEVLENQRPPAGESEFLLGLALRELGRSPSAVRHLRRAVELAPDAIEWRFQLAQQLELQGDLEQAIEQTRVCLRLEPGNPEYREFLRHVRLTRLNVREKPERPVEPVRR